MKDEQRRFLVAERLAGERLDVGLTIAGIVSSRSQGQKLISEEKVLVSGRQEKASYKLQVGDELLVTLQLARKEELIPYDFPVDVVFEDDSLIVVNKPAGLVVHPSYGHDHDTLINALIFRKTKLAPNESEEFRPGLVHRIDKGTSGLLVLAKTLEAHQSLSKQFKNKSIHRRYWALCFTHKKIESGRIETQLTRDPKNRQRFATCEPPAGKIAITHYKLLKRQLPFSLFELQLETGRTHQIRVHLSHLGCPIVGDDTYNGQAPAKNLKNQQLKKMILEMPRFALHAKELGFVHPKTQEPVTFNSSVPEDLHPLFDLGGFSEYL